MESQERRRSGRSISLGGSVALLTSIMVNKSTEELDTYIVNNTLPDEVRLVAWKIFLGILPVEQVENWVDITSAQRKSFTTILEEDEMDQIIKLIKGMEMGESEIVNDYKLITDELAKISANYDFFKSTTVAESLVKLFLIYLKIYKDSFENSKWAFYILAGLFYTLYPSIIHISNTEEVNHRDPRWLLHYMNEEEGFDSEVFFIFDNIMNHKQLRMVSKEYKQAPRQDWFDIEQKVIINLDKDFLETLNPYEKSSYYYLTIMNPELAKHLFSLKLDTYDILETWVSSLLTSTLGFERLTYFWDNIFYRCKGDRFEFLDLINIALINNLSDQLLTSNIVTGKTLLMRYPQNLDEKAVVKKALKLSEKLNE
jgi:hypothetical protein